MSHHRSFGKLFSAGSLPLIGAKFRLFREFGAARLFETAEKMEPSGLFLLTEGKSFVMKVPQLSPRAVFIPGSW